ncbi:MAG: hypothetical protein HZT43_09020 [Exiguobacterium profundum]|nr:MAG: hypothetical protein HZT43_09020 [Exiguobacterium profundum]
MDRPVIAALADAPGGSVDPGKSRLETMTRTVNLAHLASERGSDRAGRPRIRGQ